MNERVTCRVCGHPATPYGFGLVWYQCGHEQGGGAVTGTRDMRRVRR